MKTLLAAVVLASVPSLAPASQVADAVTVQLKDGRSARAQVLGVADGRAHLKFLVLGGEAEVKKSLTDFTPESALEIEVVAAKPTTFDEHVVFAKRAAELDLLGLAGREARAAVATLGSDPSAKAKELELRAWAAGALETMIRKAVAAGDSERANDCLEILTTRLADQRDEAQLMPIAESVAALDAQITAKADEERAAKRDAAKKADLEKRIAPIREKVAQGDKALNEAFAKAGNASASAKSSEKAIDAYRAAWKLAEAITKQYPDDEEIQKEAVEFGQRLEEKGIRAALHAASVLTTQGNYKGATDWVNRVIAFDPDNSEAKEMLASIQQCSASASSSNDSSGYSSNDWRWGWRGRSGGRSTGGRGGGRGGRR